MTPTMKDLGIDTLSADQRIALAFEIWESLGEDRPRPNLTDEQYAEILRRDAELDAHPELEMTWEEFRASIEDET